MGFVDGLNQVIKNFSQSASKLQLACYVSQLNKRRCKSSHVLFLVVCFCFGFSVNNVYGFDKIYMADDVMAPQATDVKELGRSEGESMSQTFGIVPQQSAAMLVRAWSPFLNYLSQNANVHVRFATAPDIPTFEKRLANGEYDIAYMNPYHYVVFHDSVGYSALAKEADKQLQGLIVVKKESPIDSLEALDSKSMAFPAPAAFAATILPRAHFKKEGITSHIRYVGSHDSVYLAVAKGMVDAGGGVGRTFNNMPENVRDQLRVLWRTPKVTPHAIATHPSLDEDIRQQILSAIESMPSVASGRKALSELNFKHLVAANDSDWDPVRDLQLGTLSQPLKE